MPPERTYKIRRSTAGASGHQIVYRLTVPPHIATLVPEATEFVPEMTEDGILFRLAADRPEPEAPSWAKKKRL